MKRQTFVSDFMTMVTTCNFTVSLTAATIDSGPSGVRGKSQLIFT